MPEKFIKKDVRGLNFFMKTLSGASRQLSQGESLWQAGQLSSDC